MCVCLYACSMYKHTKCLSDRQHDAHMSAYVSIRQHTSAYVSIRQHTSAYVSIRLKMLSGSTQTACACTRAGAIHTNAEEEVLRALLSIRQHTSAYVSIRQHTSAYDSNAEEEVLRALLSRPNEWCGG